MDEATKQFILTENEKLATMVANGFAAMHETMATKEELLATKQEMRQGFTEVDQRFDAVEERLIRIEQSVEHHGTDIARLKDDMRLVKTAVRVA